MDDPLLSLSAESKEHPLEIEGEDGWPSDAHWVRPKLVAELGFAEWASGEKLRHPRYIGIRDDKAPRDVVRETPK